MVEVKFGTKTIDLPYTIRIPGVTDEEFDDLVDEDMKAELCDGVLIVHSPASMRHDRVAEFLRTLLGLYVEEGNLGEVFGPDSLFRPRRGRRWGPDLYYLRADRVPSPLPRQFEGVPDLVLEVLSPSNRDHDLEVKRPAYRQAGIPELWFVDPDHQFVWVDRRVGRRYATEEIHGGRVASTVLPGFWLDADWLWAEPLPKKKHCLRKILARRS